MSAENSTKVSDYLFDFFRSNKGIKTILSDFNEAIGNEISFFWEKVKPIFIYEDKELTEKIEDEPENLTLQGGLTYQISKKMSDIAFNKEVTTLLEKIEEIKKINPGETNIGILAEKVKMKGKYVAGIINKK